MENLVDIVNGYRSGLYSFISGHATNTFAIAVFLSLIFRNIGTAFVLFTWALLSSYSRIYLGLHYPADIFAGAVSGSLIALLFYYLYKFFIRKYAFYKGNTSSLFTSSGYLKKDFLVLHVVFGATLFYCVISGFFYAFLH
jgi:undecaprenyl-diphosphatase